MALRSRSAEWFECKIKYEKMNDDGTMKTVTEKYVVDALSFTEAEGRIVEEMSSYISGEFQVRDIKRASYVEIFFTDADTDDKWYRARLQFITIDEKTAREKRQNVNYLVQAKSLMGAVKNIDEQMGGTMIDYEIAAVTETETMDVYEYKATADDKKNSRASSSLAQLFSEIGPGMEREINVSGRPMVISRDARSLTVRPKSDEEHDKG